MPRQFISPERKFVYYLGLTLSIIGTISFFSVFALIAISSTGAFGIPIDLAFMTMPTLGFGGFILIAIGQLLMKLGKGGLAGSGLLLDPKRARKDLEPWNRMKGGMVKDALDEAGIDLNRVATGLASNTTAPRQTADDSPAGRAPLPFDEQLRRLHALYTDGIISEQEYETKKRQILENS